MDNKKEAFPHMKIRKPEKKVKDYIVTINERVHWDKSGGAEGVIVKGTVVARKHGWLNNKYTIKWDDGTKGVYSERKVTDWVIRRANREK